MNFWVDPRNPSIPDDVVRHCASLYLTSLLLSLVILLTLLYVLGRRSRPSLFTARLGVGFALLFTACEPCVELLLRGWRPNDYESLGALLKATASRAPAWHGAACAGLVGLLLLSILTSNRRAQSTFRAPQDTHSVTLKRL
jgi:hypothetical protein